MSPSKKRISPTLLLAITLIIRSLSYSQTVTLTVKANLPSVLDETSGLVAVNKNNIWSHNDSGNNPELYNFDSTGNLLRTLVISNATNIDWEDLTTDTSGDFYIGDIGNNANNRQNLKIYHITNPSLILGDSAVAEVINYSYSDQVAFPPHDSLKNFNAEGLIAFGDSLYIFSKDLSDPYSGYTKMYRLPKIAGTHVAQLVDSFYTGSGSQFTSSITGAAISPDSSRLFLLGYSKCWIFSDFTGANFFSGTCKVLDFSGLSQKEGVCFISLNEVYITDEESNNTGQKLYYLNLEHYFSTVGVNELSFSEFSAFPNPFTAGISVKLHLPNPNNYELNIYNEVGQLVFNQLVAHTGVEKIIEIDKAVFNSNQGVYFVEISQNKKSLFVKRLVRNKG